MRGSSKLIYSSGKEYHHVPKTSSLAFNMPGQLEKKQAGIGLLNFNSSDIWFAPGDSINSTAAFHHATHLEEQAYVANRWLFTSVMIVVFIFVLLQVPHTYIRIKSSPSIWYNFKLLPPGPDEVVEKKQAGYSAPPHRTSSAKPRRRLRHIHWPIPIYRVRGFDLPLSEFIVMFTLLAAGLGVAGWCQGSFLTDASRSTLVIMFFLALTAGLGIKAGGIGSWLSYGYTAINFLHRWTGRLVLLLSTLHVVAYLVVFYKYGSEFILFDLMPKLTGISRQNGDGEARQLPRCGGLRRSMPHWNRFNRLHPSTMVAHLQIRPSRKSLSMSTRPTR